MTAAQREAVAVARALFSVSARRGLSGNSVTCESLLWQARADALSELLEADSLEAVMGDATEWADRQFPASTLQSIANHLVREAMELARQPDDAEELADVLLLAGHLINRTGIDPVAVMRTKLEVNRNRQWGAPDDHGVSEHLE